MKDKLWFLPNEILQELSRYNEDKLYEIRLRLSKFFFINYDGVYIKIAYKNYFSLTKEHLQTILIKITKHSLYAYSETIKQGFVTTDDCVRVGFGGECVKNGDEIRIIKELSSMCIRIPHEIEGCSRQIFNNLYSKIIPNVLIVSPPGSGKTTMLRDLIKTISKTLSKNILVVDERYEIAGFNNCFYLGDSVDVLSGSTKRYGLGCGIKSLSPEIVAVDELTSIDDCNGLYDACFSGVKVIATAHGANLREVENREVFKKLFYSKVFNYAIILKDRGVVSQIKIYGD